MNKKIIFGISIVINIILVFVIVFLLTEAYHALQFEYVTHDSIAAETIREYLERENYGVAASLSHPIRGGAEVSDVDLDFYMLGEYADLLFLKEVFDKSGDSGTAGAFEDRISEIHSQMPDFDVIFDKIDYSIENAVYDNDKED